MIRAVHSVEQWHFAAARRNKREALWRVFLFLWQDFKHSTAGGNDAQD